MRVCRFVRGEDECVEESIGYYFDETVIPVECAAAAFVQDGGELAEKLAPTSLLDVLPHGQLELETRRVYDWLTRAKDSYDELALPTASLRLLMPVPRPNKLFLLAGNYAKHIEEGGGIAAERAETFPYVFMKPPTTTLTNPGAHVPLPAVSPQAIDWECELAVIIGKGGKGIVAAKALSHVAGYTVINDLSDRRFRPNPQRTRREKDAFFDWLHGKWHDGFCPCGPCVTSAADLVDPQSLALRLTVNGAVQQDASTAQQIFPVAAIIEFIASFVTLEAGDIISTGTPAGVGAAKELFLRAGDRIEATIESIGTLVTSIGPAR